MRPRTRRSLLGLAASSTVTALAGCLDDSDPGDDETTAPPTGDMPATTEPTPTTSEGTSPTEDDEVEQDGDATASVDGLTVPSWLPAPAVMEGSSYWVYAGDASAIRSASLSDTADERLERFFYGVPETVLPMDEAGTFVSLGQSVSVTEYAIDTETLRDRLGDAVAHDAITVPDAGASPDGYELYEVDDGVVWLGADHLSSGPTHELLSKLRAAADGDVDRYVETTDFGAVLDATAHRDVFGGHASSQQVVQDATAFLYSWQFDDGTAEFRSAFAFESADAVADDQLADLTAEDGFVEYGEFDVQTDGRVATIDASIGIDDFDLLEREDSSSGGNSDVPQIAFDFEYDTGDTAEWDGEDGETITVTHTGGDSVALDRIQLTVGSAPVAGRDDIESTPPASDTWLAGGEWTLRPTTADAVDSGTTVSVIWTAESGDSSAVLAEATLP